MDIYVFFLTRQSGKDTCVKKSAAAKILILTLCFLLQTLDKKIMSNLRMRQSYRKMNEKKDLEKQLHSIEFKLYNLELFLAEHKSKFVFLSLSLSLYCHCSLNLAITVRSDTKNKTTCFIHFFVKRKRKRWCSSKLTGIRKWQ